MFSSIKRTFIFSFTESFESNSLSILFFLHKKPKKKQLSFGLIQISLFPFFFFYFSFISFFIFILFRRTKNVIKSSLSKLIITNTTDFYG